ncbi:unnamed protein product [Auanema sp. JU1783]|nr:unnamed protein product [Auanema sp. JU1783]
MSLLNFSPLDVHGRPYAIQEFNGKITTGSSEDFHNAQKSEVLSMYPMIDKSKLNALQHCIARDEVQNLYTQNEEKNSGVYQAWNIWNQEGITGVVEHVTSATETTNLWPIAKLGKGIIKVRNGVSYLASKVLSSLPQDELDNLLQTYGHTLDWKDNWIRCMAFHESGKRLAVCQRSDYIRVYTIINNNENVAPLTLKHPSQKNVSCMSWQMFDHRVLAVGAGDAILIWRLVNKTFTSKPSGQCAQVIDLSIGPISQIVWDRTSSSSLFAVSPNHNKIMIVDSISGEVDSVGAWTGGCITRIVPTRDGKRLAVLYTGNLLRVYDRSDWSSENWGGLDGRAVDAVWSPNGECLMFSTELSHQLFSIAFHSKEFVNDDGQKEMKLIGETVAQPMFDVSAVEFDPAELNITNHEARPVQVIGGEVQSLALSPDGQRLAVQFKHNPEVFAIFIVDWHPVLRLIPIGLAEAPGSGKVTILDFVPQFRDGSLLFAVWSDGLVQYLPLIYGAPTSTGFSKSILGFSPHFLENQSFYQDAMNISSQKF